MFYCGNKIDVFIHIGIIIIFIVPSKSYTTNKLKVGKNKAASGNRKMLNLD